MDFILEEVLMKVLLCAINAKYIHSNLAVYSLKSYAEQHKDGTSAYAADIELAEYTINQQPDDILMDIYKRKPNFIAFSVYIWNLSYVETLVREVKKLFPDTPIWLGGPEVSYDAKEVLEHLPEVTGVMMGEGEETFTDLVEYFQAELNQKVKRLEEIRGITYRKEDGTIVCNPWRETLDLSNVPFVYEHMEDFEHKIIYYESSRGCPFSCSYCLSSIDKRLRFRDMTLVKKELQFFLDHHVPQVKFVDRTFNCRHEHAMAIWTYIKEHDNGITNFHFEVAADLMNKEELALIRTMRKGLIQLEIGVQSTHLKTIDEIHRIMDFEQVKQVVQQIQSYGNTHQHLDLIAGLPYENLDTFTRSFGDVYAIKPEQLQLGFLKVLKGSYMYEHKEEYGLVYKSTPPYEVLYTNWLSYEDVMLLKMVEEMVEVYYNSGQFKSSIVELEKAFQTSFQMYQELGIYYQNHNLHLMKHSRVSRYEIFLDFAREVDKEREEVYRTVLTHDLYLRENCKNRPDFAGESTIDKEFVRHFFEQEEESHRVLKGYETYHRQQMSKMTHVEREDGKHILFDYLNRDQLTNDATTIIMEEQ